MSMKPKTINRNIKYSFILIFFGKTFCFLQTKNYKQDYYSLPPLPPKGIIEKKLPPK